MNTKGIKFLAVLAVLAMAFAAFAIISDIAQNDADDAEVVIDGYHFNFGGTVTTDITYDGYGDITVADVQSLTAEKDGDTIILSGDLVKLDNDAVDGSVLTIKKMYGGAAADLPALYGIAFKITDLPEGAKVSLNAGETTIGVSGEDALYQPLNGERTSSSVTSFTVTIKADGIHSKVYTIDFSQLIKAQLDSKKYFTISDAIEGASAGKTVKVLNDTTPAAAIVVDKAISIEGADSTQKPTITGYLVYDIKNNGGTGTITTGTIVLKNVVVKSEARFIVPHIDETLYTTNVSGLKFIFDGCDFIREGATATLDFLTVWNVKADVEIKGCSFEYKNTTGVIADDQKNMAILMNAAGTESNLSITGCTFNGFARCIEVYGYKTVTITDNDVQSFYTDNKARWFTQINESAVVAVEHNIELTVKSNTMVEPKEYAGKEGDSGFYLNFNAESVAGDFKKVDVDVPVHVEAGATLTMAGNSTVAVSGLFFNEGTVANNGTMSATGGINNVGIFTNASTLNFDGKMTTTGTFTNNGVIVCQEAFLAKILEDLVAAGDITGTGSIKAVNPSGEEVVPTVVPVEGGKVVSDEKVVITDGEVKQASAIAGQSIIISNLGADAVLDVSSSNSEVSIMAGAMAADETATIKTATGSITVKGIAGNVTFSSGSIIVKAAPWAGGDITLKNGDVLKLSGVITEASNIKFSGTGSATVIVEEGAEKKLTLNNILNITSDKIVVEVDGIIDGTGSLNLVDSEDDKKGSNLFVDGTIEANITGKATVVVNGKITGNIAAKSIGISIIGEIDSTTVGATTISVAGKLKADTITPTGTVAVYGKAVGAFNLSGANAKLVAYQDSDINSASVTASADVAKVSGVDENGGTWTYKDGEITLNGYNGVFNFNFRDTAGAKKYSDAGKIILSGDSKITYALPETSAAFVLFGHLSSIKTVQGAGTLKIELDISKADATAVAAGIRGISNEGDLSLSSVEVAVTIKGTNATWDLKDTSVYGVDVFNIEMNDSILSVDAISSLTAKKTVGIDCLKMDLSKSGITVNSAGKGIVSQAAITVENKYVATLKNGSGILATGKTLGMSVKDTSETEGYAAMDLSGVSGIAVGGGFDIYGNVDLSQNSTFVADGLTLEAGKITNNATVTLSDVSVIKKGAEIDNLATMTNVGTLNVFGKLENRGGTFTNDGTITVFSKEYNDPADQTAEFDVADDLSKISATAAELFTIVLNDYEPQDNGTLKIKKATASFAYKEGSGITDADFKDLDAFTGTLIPVQTSSGKDYALSLSNGTATITLVYNSSATGGEKLGEKYSLTVSGTIVKNDGVNKFSVVMPTGASKAVTDGIDDVIKDATPASTYLKVAGGKMINNSVVSFHGVAGGDGYEFVSADAEYEGSVVAGAQTLKIVGKLTGDVTSKGAVNVNGKGLIKGNVNVTGAVTVGDSGTSTAKIDGNVTTKGAVSITAKASIVGDITSDSTVTSAGGAIKGNVTAKDDVTVYNVDGNITVDKNGDYKVTIKGKVLGTLTYNSAAKATVPGEGEKVDPTTYPVVMTIDVDLDATNANALIINLNKAIDATETEAVKKGYFSIGNADVSELSDGKNVNLTMVVGKLLFPETMEMPVRYAIVFEADTIAEVSSVATIDFSKSALKVSKDATSNFVTGTTTVTEYGLVKAIMSFAIEGGAYTIYSGITYALTNCEENSELIVELDATLTDNVAVKAGVNIIISDKVTLDFDKYGIDMDDGAKITLVGTGKVTFKETGQNLYPGDDTKDYDYYTVNGTIVFDDDNVIVLDGVRFTDDSSIVGLAATETELSKLSVDLKYNEGIVTIYDGITHGKFALENREGYYLTKADAEQDKKTYVAGHLTINEGAILVVTDITDAGEEAIAPEDVITYSKIASTINNNGLLKFNKNFTLTGTYGGLGEAIISDNVKITIAKGNLIGTDDDIYYGAVAFGKFIDTLGNGYVLNMVVADPAIAGVGGEDLSITAKKTSTDQYMELKGGVGLGIITATDVAVLNDVNVLETAVIVADEVQIVSADSDVTGKIMAKVMRMAPETGFKTLNYNATFEEEGYTVYTVFANIDFDEVSDVTIVKDLKISDMVDGDAKKLDLSGKDVNIEIAEGKKLILDKPLIIGTPIDSIGAEGSSIVGKVVIGDIYLDGVQKKYANAYIVAYSDVDLTEAEIYGYDGKTAAVYSILDIEDIPYAIIFANENGAVVGVDVAAEAGQVLATVDKSIVPVIEGYTFTKWYNYDETEASFVGQTNAYAGAKAITVFVTVKFVEGVSYYCDGVEFAIYDTPTKVEYNSVFTAKINNTAKYQGTPVINGKNSYIVTEDSVLVASGVSPIPVPPEPEPVIGDSGLSLTDILLIVLVVLIAIMVVILVLRLNRS